MRKQVLLLFILLGLSTSLHAQDDLLGDLRASSGPTSEPVENTFKSTRIVTGHNAEMRGKRVLEFIIMHRFGRLNSGAYELFGLDNSNIRFGLEYGLSNRINIGVGRSSFEKTFDGFAKVQWLQQKSGDETFPFSLTTLHSIAVNTLEELAFNRPDFPFSARLTYTNQLLIARKFSDGLSLQLMPTWIHRNEVTAPDINNVYSMGIGGRIKVSDRVALNGEYYYQTNRPDGVGTFNPLSIGVDIETGGHVFQLHVTNSRTMIEKGFIAETDGDLGNGDIHFGFNISRVFDL